MDNVQRRSTTTRALVAAGWVALGVIAGIVASRWVLPEGNEVALPEERAAVPEACLDALQAARARLLLNEETSEVVTSYPQLVRRAADAVAALDAAEMRALLEEARALNERGRDLIERAGNTDFSTPARRCEDLAEHRDS